MDVNYNDVNELVPYGKLDAFVEKMKQVEHWMWHGESSMEIRFMPSLAGNTNQIGFILNFESNLASKLLLNDINSKNYDKKISLEFLREDLDETFFKNKKNAFLNRASYIIFGVPKTLIEGILVDRKYEKDDVMLDKLKGYFPNCYICNLDGKVIRK